MPTVLKITVNARKKHWLLRGGESAGYSACGKLIPIAHLTTIHDDVTCKSCRRTYAYKEGYTQEYVVKA